MKGLKERMNTNRYFRFIMGLSILAAGLLSVGIYLPGAHAD